MWIYVSKHARLQVSAQSTITTFHSLSLVTVWTFLIISCSQTTLRHDVTWHIVGNQRWCAEWMKSLSSWVRHRDIITHYLGSKLANAMDQTDCAHPMDNAYTWRSRKIIREYRLGVVKFVSMCQAIAVMCVLFHAAPRSPVFSACLSYSVSRLNTQFSDSADDGIW